MKRQSIRLIVSLVFGLGLLLSTRESKAQFYSIKTNLLEIAALGTVNADFSMMVSKKWTVNVDLACNPWTFADNMKLKHWTVEPGARYWFWQSYTGSFISMYGIGTRFNGGFGKRYDGHGFGVGVTYGYAWAVGRRWNIEAEIGVGALWSKYSVNECRTCGDVIKPSRNYLVPAPKAAVSIVYLF